MNKDNCVVLMIDIQEKLVKATDADIEAKNAYKILKTANLMNIPVIVTEQYPKGLGETVSELKSVFNENTFLFEKTDFSAFTTFCFTTCAIIIFTILFERIVSYNRGTSVIAFFIA